LNLRAGLSELPIKPAFLHCGDQNIDRGKKFIGGSRQNPALPFSSSMGFQPDLTKKTYDPSGCFRQFGNTRCLFSTSFFRLVRPSPKSEENA
jgi:hypothetical protein